MANGGSPAGFELRQVMRPRVQVHQRIREAILGGEIAQGAKLPPETDAKAIERGSAAAAEAAMVEHLEYVLRYSTEIVRAPA